MNDETVFPLPLWVVFIATLLFGCPANAEPLFQMSAEGTSITIYSEPCALKEVSNLPRRATWVENGKSYEGCWGASPLGVVMMYFTDKTVAVVPAQAFTKVNGV